jgi:hypothetical protein
MGWNETPLSDKGAEIHRPHLLRSDLLISEPTSARDGGVWE